MLLQAFTIYDSKAEHYLPPFFQKTSALALRAFAQAANTVDHDFNLYAADYTLFRIGQYDDHNGKLECLDAFENLGTGLQQIRPARLAAVQDPSGMMDIERKENG